MVGNDWVMTDNNEMHYVGFCSICGTGPLGLRECGRCGEIVVLCDECDAVWTDADFAAKPRLADEHGKLPCPYCEASLLDAPSGWASKSQVDKLAWLQTALQSGGLKIKQGSPLSQDNSTSD